MGESPFVNTNKKQPPPRPVKRGLGGARGPPPKNEKKRKKKPKSGGKKIFHIEFKKTTWRPKAPRARVKNGGPFEKKQRKKNKKCPRLGGFAPLKNRCGFKKQTFKPPNGGKRGGPLERSPLGKLAG